MGVQPSVSTANSPGRQGFFSTVSRNANKHARFRVSLVRRAIWRFLILSSAFVLSRPFSDFPNAMTLLAPRRIPLDNSRLNR